MVRLIVVGLLAFAVALTGAAYAEVQNIKVSGDLDLKGISQHNYDLKEFQGNTSNDPNAPREGGDAANTDDDSVGFFLSTVRVRVDADLTDNVQASVRLLNQRVWDVHAVDIDDVHVNNAYLVLKEFLYSPLTVIAGRQDLQYGTGFIVGPGILADPYGVFGVTDSAGVHTGGIGQEHSASNAYDAIRLILDFAPLTVEGVYAKLVETGVFTDDHNLYGVVVNYKLDQWNAEIEPYWFWKNNESEALVANDRLLEESGTALASYDRNDVHTIGLRLAGSPIENLRLSGEGAHQMGEIEDDSTTEGGVSTGAQLNQERDRDAWAAQIRAEYDWVTVPWTPTTGVGWVFYSGEDSAAQRPNPIAAAAGETGLPVPDQGNDDFNAWDPMYRGQFHTFIQDFFDGRDAPASIYATADVNDTASSTNRHLIFGDIGLKPMEDITLWARYTHVRFAEAPRSGRSHHAGDEIDVKAVYDYTEDVTLAAWGGLFLPGDYYDEPIRGGDRSNQAAWVTGGSASVKF